VTHTKDEWNWKRLSLIAIAFGCFFTLLSGSLPWAYRELAQEPWAVDTSPDGRFRLEYFAAPFLPFRPLTARGWGCTDCPGYLRLIDARTGGEIEGKYFRMMHEVSNGIHWEKHRVRIRLFANWVLPAND
jgi:hypothetical protein